MNRIPCMLTAVLSVSCVLTIANAQQPPRKPRIDDTIKANVYADNAFKLYINGELVAVDSISFVPHNVVSVDVLPAYPMTIAVMGIDNADPKTGMEYANTNIGDGGFILKLGDGTVTNATWKAKKFSWGPIDGDMKNPRVKNIPLPKDWFAIDFDDSQWPNAKEFTEEEVGPKEPFFEHDFKGAKFIWSDDVKLDNLVLFRTVVKSPPDGKDRPDFRGLTDVVPQGGGRQGGGRRSGDGNLGRNENSRLEKSDRNTGRTKMRFGQFIVALTACALWMNGLSVARGHDGHDHTHHNHASDHTDTMPVSRMWKIESFTVSRTPTTVEASLLTAENDQVKLQTTDGRVVAIPKQVLTPDDRKFVQQRQEQIHNLNTQPVWQLTAFRPQGGQDATESPALANFFKPFAKDVKVRWDRDFLFVESTGMPDHPMMTGITAWQQQVPLPQSYTSNNAWRIPLHPVPAKNPMSTKEHFFRGAIALAVNGVPIFNPIKNDGRTDTLQAGELDQWGGHCGRADDYHYHIAPVHLENVVGAGNPIAVALDGYPIYSYNDPNGKPPTDLDWLNGHQGPNGEYHYHATKTFPYLNGGFYGEVVELNGQVDPQPRAQGVRPSLPGLKGAKIVGFENPKPGSFVVRYEVFGEPRSVEYTVADNGSATFSFVSAKGTKTENYTPRQEGGGDGRRNAERPTGIETQGSRGPVAEGGGDPLVSALDVNGDGQIDKTELRGAAAALRKLDNNKDGQITTDELRGPGGQALVGQRRGGESNMPRGEGPPPGQAGGPKGPQPGEGPRQPWILVHADEIDLDQNKIISRDEIVGEATKAFAGYDADNDDKLSAAELSGRSGSRSAMGGFLKGHSKEIDRDGDGILTRAEAIGNAERMFDKMDIDGDGKITSEEIETSRRK